MGLALRSGKFHHGLELVIARAANPEVADAALVDVFGPFRRIQRSAALGAWQRRMDFQVAGRTLGADVHWGPPACCSLPLRPQCAATLARSPLRTSQHC